MINTALHTIYITLVLTICLYLTPYYHNVKISTKDVPASILESKDKLHPPILKIEDYIFCTITALFLPIISGTLIYIWIITFLHIFELNKNDKSQINKTTKRNFKDL